MKKKSGIGFFVLMFIYLGCSSAPRYTSVRAIKGRPGQFIFKEQIGVASYYGEEFHGRPTASGEKFDMNDLTAAHQTLPFGTKIEVTNLENSKKVVVKVNDRGPFVKGRILDLSKGAAEKIGIIETGTAIVKIVVLDFQ